MAFPPGTTTQPAIVRIFGDSLFESNETFFVTLSSGNNATIARAQGVGTILDDCANGRCQRWRKLWL